MQATRRTILLAAMWLVTTLPIGYGHDASGAERHAGLLTPPDALGVQTLAVSPSQCQMSRIRVCREAMLSRICLPRRKRRVRFCNGSARH